MLVNLSYFRIFCQEKTKKNCFDVKFAIWMVISRFVIVIYGIIFRIFCQGEKKLCNPVAIVEGTVRLP